MVLLLARRHGHGGSDLVRVEAITGGEDRVSQEIGVAGANFGLSEETFKVVIS